MKIFLSWSGETSRLLAEAFRAWLPDVLQYLQPYFSPEDIVKGARWHADISRELSTSQVGLIFLTANNLNAPWLLFEAGAISKSLDSSRLCPLLFGVENSQVSGPLQHFQSTPFNKDEIFKVLETINSVSQEKSLSSDALKRTFDRWWSQLEDAVKEILANADLKPLPQHRPVPEMMEETLALVREIAHKKGSSAIEVEPINHWIMMFDATADYAKRVINFAVVDSEPQTLDQLKELKIHLTFFFNLVVPKLAKSRAWPPRSVKANELMKSLDAHIARLTKLVEDEDDIPF